MTLLLYMAGHGRRCGYRHILDAFWDEAKLAGVPLPTEEPVSAPAFCQARAKLSAEFLRSLLREVGARFDARFEQDARWRGRRVLATDCTGLNLQRSEELLWEFGKADSAYCPQAQVSTLFNVKSRVPIDVVIARYKASERESLLEDHLPLVARGDVLLLDRGYPGFGVFEKLLEVGADFVARVPTKGGFSAVGDFLASGGQDRIIELVPTPGSSSISMEPLQLRAIRSKRPDGEDVVFVTTLKRSDGYSRKVIEELYHLRWEVEEHYKAFKSDYMGQGQLHSRSAAGVRQEVLAISLFHALSRYFSAAAAAYVDAPYDDLSNKSACLGLSGYIVRLFACADHRAADWLRDLLVRIARTRDKKRPGRSFPRRSLRPRPKWGPAGRLRA